MRLGATAKPQRLAAELEMQPLVARRRLGLGILHAQAGQRERAKIELDLAGRLFRDMAMNPWLVRVEGTLDASP
jgi:hypothetical protein